MNEYPPTPNDAPLVDLQDVSKSYGSAGVLQNCSLQIMEQQTVAVTGPSGCGKTTLLNLIGGMDRADGGRVLLAGQEVSLMNEPQVAAMRRRELGFVFQHHYLLPQCTALENVLVPVLGEKNRASSEAVERARGLLAQVGLDDRINHRPSELSGGQRQRVAVVRALINQPRLLLADEPTGALDETAANQLTELLLQLNRTLGLTLLIVTHDASVASRMSRRLVLREGKLHDDTGTGAKA